MWFGWGWGFMIWGPICLILVGIGIYYLITSQKHDNHATHSTCPPTQQYNGRAIELLKERYAKGEITKEQFLEMKQELKK